MDVALVLTEFTSGGEIEKENKLQLNVIYVMTEVSPGHRRVIQPKLESQASLLWRSST